MLQAWAMEYPDVPVQRRCRWRMFSTERVGGVSSSPFPIYTICGRNPSRCSVRAAAISVRT